MKRLAIPAAVMLIAAALAVAAFEVLLRAVGYSAPVWYQPDPHLGWTLRPGASGVYDREGRGFVQVNTEGRRDVEHSVAKPDDVYRIALLGDSYAEAMQVEREQTFWARLPDQLRACGFQPGKRIEVLNFGVSGYGTAQEYLMLGSVAMRYRPDLVLLQFTNGNDVRNNSAALDDEKARPFFKFQPDGSLRLDASFATSGRFADRNTFVHDVVREVSDHSRVVQLVRNVRTPVMAKAHAASDGVEQGLEAVVLAPPREREWDEAWKITEALIARAGELSARHGAKFVVVTVPYAIQVHPDERVRLALQAKLGVPDLFYPDRRISEFSKRHGILTVALAYDMQRFAQERSTYFHGFSNVGMGRGHWNPEGHRVAAELIARQLCTQQF